MSVSDENFIAIRGVVAVPRVHAAAAWLRAHPLAILVAVLGVIYTFALINHAPVPSMEPRFAEAIREMAARGQYLIPIKNGVPYIEYPPLFFWLGLAGYVAGLPLTAAIRLPGYIALLLWVVALARLQRRLFPDWPRLLLALPAAALPGILYNFFTAQSDSVLILGVLVAFTGYAARERHGFNWELWLGVTLATLAKGPVGLAITLPVIGIDIVIDCLANASTTSGRWRLFRQRFAAVTPWRGIALVIAINAPWYVAAGFAINWEFVRAVLVYQNFTRFLVGFDHAQPWWYYAQTIWYDLFPLAFLLPFGIWCAAKRIGRFEWRMPLVWALWTLLFFSLSESKQGKYILPAAPAIALLALAAPAQLLSIDAAARIRQWLARWAVFLIGVFAVLVIGVLPLDGARLLDQPGYAKLKAAMAARPGALVTYLWPRANMLYEFGAPLAYAPSARALYEDLRTGRIEPGDYLLVNAEYLPGGDAYDTDQRLEPVPAPPYFEPVVSVQANGDMRLYRVLPGAARLPLPDTPSPPPRHWWDQFDTD